MMELFAIARHHGRGPGGGPGIEPQVVGGMWGFGGMFRLITLALLVTLVVLMILSLRRSQTVPPSAPLAAAVPMRGDPLEIARVRYARGEVTREEYLRLVEDLTIESG